MLKEIRLNNLAIIKDINIEFKNNFISLTGETGAGKSILLNGISLLIGEKVEKDLLRSDSDKLLAEGVFYLNDKQIEILSNMGFEIEDEELIIQRKYERDGKSKAFLNGMRIPANQLKEITSQIIDLVGQHDHQYLLNKNYHLQLVDNFLDDNGQKVLQKIKKDVKEINTLNKKIIELEKIKEEILEKKDLLEFQIDEINELNLNEGEDDSLEEEYKILFNAGKISENLSISSNIIKEGDYSILSTLRTITKRLEHISDYSKEYEQLHERVDKVYYELEDLSDLIDDYFSDIESDDSRLDYVVNRINSINKLKMKYGSTISEILKHKNSIEEKLKITNSDNSKLTALVKEKKELVNEYYKNAKMLSDSRKKVSKSLEKQLKEELKDLNMDKAEIKIQFDKIDSITQTGEDKVEILISLNVGEELKSLSKIASGGEISRIMLALKSIFSKADNISVLIFDEIDTGIGGETVKKVAEKLKKLSEHVQIICVSHSAQIAAKSTQQFSISKKIVNNSTETTVKELSMIEREEEIARMLSGKVSDISLEHAREIINKN